jgi:hypothetical protein
MGRIQQEVKFLRDDGAGHSQDHGSGLSNPKIAEPSGAAGSGFRLPVWRQVCQFESGHECLVERHLNEQVAAQELWGVKMNQHLKCGQSARLRSVDHGHARRVPPAAVKACAFSCEGLM